MTDELEKGKELLQGIEDRTWKDVEYSCRECENSWISLEYLKEFHKKDFSEWNNKDWIRIQKTVVLNFWRTRDYPNDFSPIPQICPICNSDLSTETLEGSLTVQKTEKEEESGDYIKQLSVLAPVGYSKIDIR
jgi:hypothetical protein